MSRRGEPAPPRAVIDIGSNTVRLVIYDAPLRAPTVLLNEKVTARLGRDLTPDGGAMPAKAVDQALAALARFALLVRDMGAADVQTVATAAPREAANGPEFLSAVRALGLEPRLLTGEEEARASADGVIAAFPGARGVVADLGGGSLELVSIGDGTSHHGISLPLGTLRLPALAAKGPEKFARTISKALADAGRVAEPGPLYLVGGTWRAFAAYAIRALDWPLSDPHAFTLPREEADRMARRAARTDVAELAAMPGISGTRAAALPDAATLLRRLLEELQPDGIEVSSWGLREGLLYQRLDADERAKDPLIAAVIAFAAPRRAAVTEATRLAAWTAAAADGRGADDERLRLAATMLALALARTEPNLRARQAIEWALEKRWIGIGARGRAMLAAALLASCGKTEVPAALTRLAPAEAIREATGWGLAIRLARRMSVATKGSTAASNLTLEDGVLTLAVERERAALAGEGAARDLAALAGWLGAEPRVAVGA